jgi:hypothetical protein
MSDMAPAPHGGPASQHHGGDSMSWIIGGILVLLGVAFLLERVGGFVMTENWWAVFIYIGAIAAFGNAWRTYSVHGEFGPAAGGSLVWGLALTVVASLFIFNADWDKWWPAILIAVGAGMVVAYLLGNATRKAGPGGQ